MRTTWVRVSTITSTGLGALLLGMPAWANTAAALRAGQAPTTAATFATHDCERDRGGGPYAAQDVWSFVLPDRSRRFVSLTASLDTNRDGSPDTTPAATVTGGGEEDSGTSKAWFVAPAGAVLLGASAVVSGSASPGVTFNIAATCPALASPSASPSPAPPSSTPSAAAPSLSSAAIVVPTGAGPSSGESAGAGGGQRGGFLGGNADVVPPGVTIGEEGFQAPGETADPSVSGSPYRTGASPADGGPGLTHYLLATGAFAAVVGSCLLLVVLRRRNVELAMPGRHRLLDGETDV
ncbi:hypothetical protein [Hamadaea tsunoensis]|uniref:hypothetical protein n=1 Tax=Hamadaea tsunoensis TaxID=53368 RepID=UPI000420A007|nr:hypothetical protein [Hamadaea tsunoensis]